jgi:uncharacterized membrane protein YcaP (DUF421 family)
MKNRRWSLLQFFGFTVIGVFILSRLLGRPFIDNMTGGDFVSLIGTGLMFGLAIWCLVDYFSGRRSS